MEPQPMSPALSTAAYGTSQPHNGLGLPMSAKRADPQSFSKEDDKGVSSLSNNSLTSPGGTGDF